MKSKVLIIAFEFPPFRGGIANYSHSFAKWLGENDYKVTVLTLNAFSKPDAAYSVLNPKWKYHPKGKILILRKLISFIYRIYQYFFLLKILLYVVTSVGRSQVVITSLFVDFSRLALRLFNKASIKYEIVLHGLDIHELSQRMPAFFESVIVNADRIIFNSIYTQRLFHVKYRQARREFVAPPLLDTQYIDSIELLSREQLEKTLGIRLDRQFIISVCRLVLRKGIDIAINAISMFLKDHENWVYLIAGVGDEMENLKKLVSPALAGRIIFLGNITNQVKFSLLHHATIFIMPNRNFANDVEGFGISFLEASYMRTWVIGGNSGGVPEAIDTRSNGFLVNVDENVIDSINERLKLVADKEAKEVLQRGRQFVIDNFSLGGSAYKGYISGYEAF